MYEIKKLGAMWRVLSIGTELVQFQSLRRINCTDWVRNNGGTIEPAGSQTATTGHQMTAL